MAQRLYLPIEQVFSDLGAIGAGYKLNTYETGTTTPKATYSNVALSSANTNPIVADSAGRLGDIFVDDLSTYKIVVTDADDVEIWSADPVDPKTFSLADFDPRPTSFWGTTAGTSTAYTLDADPDVSTYSSTQTFYFACHTDCGDSPTMAVDGLAALNLKKYDNDGSKVSLVTGDMNSGQTYHARNDGTDIVIFNPEIPANISSTTTKKGYSYLPNQITISNGTDTDHDIDFTAGNAQAINGSKVYRVGALTKQIDATWAAGTNQGALDTGTVANDTPYYFYAIENLTTGVGDILFTASTPTAGTKAYSGANMPSGWGNESYLGACHTDGSANIRNGTWRFSLGFYEFEFDVGILDFSDTNPGTSATLKTMTCPSRSKLMFNAYIFDDSEGSNTPQILFTSPDQTATSPATGSTAGAFSLRVTNRGADGANNGQSSPFGIWTNDSSEIRYQGTISAADTRLDAYSMGWKEYL